MNDLGILQKRVGDAVEKLRLSEQQRREYNDSLGRLLNDLEIKFEARKIEVDHCQQRIRKLEESNRVLTGLVGELVDIVEHTADFFGEDPVYRTTAAAGEIVTRYIPDSPANDVRSGVSDDMAESGRYEDVAPEDLLAEDLYEKSEGSADFPRLVFDAVALARGEEPMGEPAVLDIPEPAGAEETEESGSDSSLGIKEIMARLEIAAERAQIRADRETRTDRPQLGQAAGA